MLQCPWRFCSWTVNVLQSRIQSSQVWEYKEGDFDLNWTSKPENLTIYNVVNPFPLTVGKWEDFLMLASAGESSHVIIIIPQPLYLLVCFCLSSQKRSLPRLLQAAKEHNQHISCLLLSAQLDNTVLHRDLHRQGLNESENPDLLISILLTALCSVAAALHSQESLAL